MFSSQICPFIPILKSFNIFTWGFRFTLLPFYSSSKTQTDRLSVWFPKLMITLLFFSTNHTQLLSSYCFHFHPFKVHNSIDIPVISPWEAKHCPHLYTRLIQETSHNQVGRVKSTSMTFQLHPYNSSILIRIIK